MARDIPKYFKINIPVNPINPTSRKGRFPLNCFLIDLLENMGVLLINK
jgi:hypothetical protein